MTDAEKLISLGVPTQLALELVRMMSGGLVNDGPITQAQFDDHEARIAALEEASEQFIAQD